MTELKENGAVCVVTVYNAQSRYIFGVYDTLELARKRVQDHRELGIISDTDYVSYDEEVVWVGA